MKWNGGTKELLKKKGGRRNNTVNNNVFFGSDPTPRNNPKRARINESHLKSISLWSEAAGLSLNAPIPKKILPILGNSSSSLKPSSKDSNLSLFPTFKPFEMNKNDDDDDKTSSTKWHGKTIITEKSHFSTISDEPKISSLSSHTFSETESQNSVLQYSLLLAPKKFLTTTNMEKNNNNNMTEEIIEVEEEEEKKKKNQEKERHSFNQNNTFLRPTFSPGSTPFFESLSLRASKKNNQEQQAIVFWNEGKQVEFLE